MSCSISDSHSISNEDLVKAAQEGNKDAVTVLTNRYIAMVKKIAFSYSPPKEDIDDLSQEGMIALVKAISAYKFDTEASFTTFAYICVRNQIVSFLRRNNSLGKLATFDFGGDKLQKSENISDLLSPFDPEQLVINEEKIKHLQHRLNEVLSPLEYDVLMWHTMDFTYDEISKKLNVSSKSVDNAIQRIRRKLSSEKFN